MRSLPRRLGWLLAGLGTIATLGCEPLTLPVRSTSTDGGDSVTDEGIPTNATDLGDFGGVTGLRTWTKTDDAGTLTQFSIFLPFAAINSGGTAMVEKFLPIPEIVAQQTVLRSMQLLYLPVGHAPAGVYDLPHWEWHLFTLPEAEVIAIDCSNPKIPSTAQLPPNHIVISTCIVRGGMHASDLSFPEFSGGRFSRGVYGSYYDARFIGIEPKVASAVLLERAPFSMPSYDPTPLGDPGNYPRRVDVSYLAEGVVFSAVDWYRHN